MKKQITFAASGDYLQTRRIASYEAPGFKKIADLLHTADARVTNLEVPVSYNEGTPGAFPGGTHIQTPPDRLEDLIRFGFNLVGTANNHAFDFNYEGLKKTNAYLDQYGILHTGTGDNLYEAEKPVYLDTLAGRVALISIATPMFKAHLATEQRRNCKGRPGINGLRYKKMHTISIDDFTALKRIAQQTEVNALYEMAVKEGFVQALPENILLFGIDLPGNYMLFTVGEQEGLMTAPEEQDMKRIERTIDDARRQSDYVLVSCHCHEMKGSDKSLAPDFLPQAARRFIDAGANAFIGHGPHVLRGIEIYKKCPIFYSLGNFIFQNETLELLPQDFYDQNKIPNDFSVMQAMDKKSNNGTKGLLYIREVMESVIPYWTMENGTLTEVSLYPIELGYGRKRHQSGFPEITKNENILNRLKELSKAYGTEIRVENGIGKIRI